MAEYIEREALFEIVEQQGHVTVDDIIAIPAADVAPVVHGEWIWTESGESDYEQYWICSACGDKSYTETPYCSNCGAKMKEA